jgi:MAM domain, meprin/A5/mu/Secretion system C-terminal sorting domain
VSDTMFTIMRAPGGLRVTFVCPDSIGLAWTALTGSTGYTVSKLGSKYMDPVGTTTSTNFTIHGIDPLLDHWVSVNAHGPNGGRGYRANAIRVPPGLSNCSLSVNGTVISILSPAPGINTTCQDFSNTHVALKIKNTGVNTISNFTINYSFDGGTTVSENFLLPVAPGAIIDYTFLQNLSMPSSGNHDLKTWISVGGDLYANDDTSEATISVVPGTTAPANVNETFESMPLCSTISNCESGNCTMRNGWINASNNTLDDIDWRVSQGLTPTTSTGPDIDHTMGNATGNYIYLEASTCSNRQADLISPCINLNGVAAPKLTFWYHMYGADMGSLHLDIIGENQVYTDFIPAHVGNRGTSWLKDSADLSQFSGQTIVIKFRGITGNDLLSDMALDDISIFDMATGIEVNPEAAQFVIYPNPGKGVFNFSTGNLSGKNQVIRVYDMLGEVVFEKTLSDNSSNHEGVIDLSEFANGVYTFTYRSEEHSKVERVVKGE